MQIVIDISEEEYNLMKEKSMFGKVSDWKRAIKNGVPLPNGHGRLIDVDALFPTLPAEEIISRMSVQYAPVILEADTETDGLTEEEIKETIEAAKRDATEQNIKALTRIKENYERVWRENLLSEDLVREEYEAVCAGIDALTKTI